MRDRFDIAHEELADKDITANSTEDSFFFVFKKLSRLALPMSLSYTFSFQLVLLVYFLSKLDEDEEHRASISLISNLINALIIIGISPLFAMSFEAGEAIGALQEAEALAVETETKLQSRRNLIAAINRNGLILSSAMAIPMTLGLVFPEPMLRSLFHQNPKVAKISQDFTRIYAVTVLPQLLRVCFEQVLFSFGKTKPAMYLALSNFTVSMGLGGLLAFGVGGLPKQGKSAIEAACIADSLLTSTAFGIYIAKHPDFAKFPFFNLLKPSPESLTQLLSLIKKSGSFLFAFSTETLINLANGLLAGALGTKEQAAFSATMQYSLLTLLFQAAFGQSSAQEMSRELGAKRYAKMSTIGKHSISTTLAYIAPVPIILSLAPTILFTLLGIHDKEQQTILRRLIPIIAAGCIADSVRFNLLQQLRLLGDGNCAALISTGILSLGVASSAILGLKTNMGIYGVATGYSAAMTAAAAILFKRRNKRLVPQAILEWNEKKAQAEQASQSCPSTCLDSWFSRKKRTGHRSDFGIELQIPLLPSGKP